MSELSIKHQAIADIQSSLVRQVRLSDGASRVELARQFNLAPSTVGLYVDRLIGEGFLQEGPKAQRTSGRPPTILEPNPQAGQFIGVDFDARQIALASVDFSRQLLERRQGGVLASDGPDQVLEKIVKTIAEAATRQRLLGIGLAVPGTIDSQRGVALHYAYIRGWQDVPVVERLARRFGVPVHLENNIRAMALAEQWFGEARGVDQFVCLGIRSGIGAGVVIDGRLHGGYDDLAGEIGGWPCEVRETAAEVEVTTLEEVASLRSILAHLTEEARRGTPTSLVLKRGQVTLEELLRAARQSDPLTLEAIRRAARAIGRVISQISLLLNPQKVILAGPLVELQDVFLEPVRETVDRLATPRRSKSPHIVASQFGAYGASLGAAALAVEHWKPVPQER